MVLTESLRSACVLFAPIIRVAITDIIPAHKIRISSSVSIYVGVGLNCGHE